MKSKYLAIVGTALITGAIALGYSLAKTDLININFLNEAFAAGGKVDSPTGVAPDRYVYYPGTEELAMDEIRVIACGTGLPAARRGQAATCFLIETGNGDKFIFDIGTGSMANLASLMIPFTGSRLA